MTALRATGIDHIVLRVEDPEVSLLWYRDKLGLTAERLEEWRRGAVPFVSVRVDATTIIDLFAGERDGVNVDHVAIVVDEVDLDEVAASGEFETLGPPTEVWGARGMGRGLYVRDPDGNTVELRVYPQHRSVAGGQA